MEWSCYFLLPLAPATIFTRNFKKLKPYVEPHPLLSVTQYHYRLFHFTNKVLYVIYKPVRMAILPSWLHIEWIVSAITLSSLYVISEKNGILPFCILNKTTITFDPYFLSLCNSDYFVAELVRLRFYPDTKLLGKNLHSKASPFASRLFQKFISEKLFTQSINAFSVFTYLHTVYRPQHNL